MIYKIMHRVLLASILFAYTEAYATTSFIGKWVDNASGVTRLGNIIIEQNTITIQGVARYSTVDGGVFGKGELFKVTGVDHPSDPMGCGPAKKITYFIITPLPDDPNIPQHAIQLWFYSGSTPPEPSTIENDGAVCLVQPYGRL